MQCLAEPHDVQANRIFQMKRTTIVGNIGRDAVCREGDGGHKFVSFSVAYAERKTNETDEQGNPVTVAQWAECEIYVGPESSAEGLLKLLTKEIGRAHV